ncbi:MAG TPA: DUF5724 domain-containing protein [Lacipirellulaceae bacterium]|jgi:hypothetical protein|nr:DUF5724 domain-containing protein [Lacipirellulaceae bacterium]
MLKPEQAQARLAEWKLPEDPNRIAADVKRLPAKLRDLAARAYNVAEKSEDDDATDGAVDWQEVQRRFRANAIEVDRLPAKDRIQIFSVAGPKIAPAIESTWQLLKTAPYQVSYQMKAFRAPGVPELSADVLYSWLHGIGGLAANYQADVLTPNWLAIWAAHISDGYRFSGVIGPLLAAVLNERSHEANEVVATLHESLLGQHEIGGPGRHIYTAFLLSNRPEAWEAVEKTLLAAQRQEGVRQAILESIDLAHPEAFRRMLRLILEHDLYRFSSVVRAVDVWFGELWAAASGGGVKKMLEQVVEMLDRPAARDKALKGKDPEAAFLALWCAATEDMVASVALAKKLLTSKSVEMRYVAARHLTNLEDTAAAAAIVPALDDEDLRVALLAASPGYVTVGSEELTHLDVDDRFERLERLVDRLPSKPQKLKPIVWPWNEVTVKQSQVAGLLPDTLGGRPATRLIPHLRKMDTYNRRNAVEKIVEAKPWDEAKRRAIVDLAGDTSEIVRGAALEALLDQPLKADEVEQLEGYLTRKTGDLRRGVLAILLKQKDAAALTSSTRLLAAKDSNQRLAGLELLRLMTDAQRCVPDCRSQAAAYQAARKKLTKEEQGHLAEIATEKVAAATLDDALGLMNLAERRPVVPPRNRKVPFITPAAVACLKALDDLVHEHRETTIRYESHGGPKEELLGNVRWGFPSPNYKKPRESEAEKLPLAEVWTKWYAKRPASQRDKDGLELVRALIWCEFCDEWEGEQWKASAKSSPQRKRFADAVSGGHEPKPLRYQRVVAEVIEWLMFLNPRDAHDYLLDALESAYALMSDDRLKELVEPPKKEGKLRGKLRLIYPQYDDDSDWRDARALDMWVDAMSMNERTSGTEPNTAQQVRLWQLLRWLDEPIAGARRRRVETSLLRVAYSEGAANLADVADHLLGPRGSTEYSAEDFTLLSELSARKPEKEIEKWISRHPEVRDLVERAVARIVDLELNRGDAPTAATAPANSVQALSGIETLRRILQALGKNEFKLGVYWRFRGSDNRRESLTQLARKTYPADGEMPDDFVETMKRAVAENQFAEERVLQLTFLAPQWIKHVEAYFGWPGMDEGLYWFLAHMHYVGGLAEVAAEAAGDGDPAEADAADDDAQSDDLNTDEADGDEPQRPKLSAWERLILERTPLSDAERREGAIDVPWFQRTYEQLGDKRWQQLATAARFAANANQAKRAAFVADVLLGRVSRKQLIDGIKKRQLKDHVRLLGLLPLAKGNRHDADLLERCKVLREYRRYANQLSGLTKPAALRSWEIGMRNMAQTAGYADPLRLEWAVGAEAVKDLAKGPVVAKKDGVTISLSLDEMSKPVVTVLKGDKELKSIPPAVKKDKKVAELTARVTELKRQASGIRQSLETAMCRGDTSSGSELRDWCAHALVAPLLSRLVVVGEGIFGYPDKQGKALRDFAGKLEPVKTNETLRLAHPHDLLESDAWHDWQRECFQSERVQPFKQVFRELYVVTKQERKDGAISHRYDGQQIQPKQALALFGQRGWNTQDGVFKVFHDAQLTASVDFQFGFGTPLEVEGATLAGVSFRRRDEWKPMPLADVPARLFSEVMRDVDLVVSVAHAGGVDPEASASTVEMRANLVRETCELLGLKNVRLKPSHALVEGELASYSVHLGSGTVHRMPGGSLCVVPVHSQHRGRLFLPFADDDPRTAEVISKVLLFARDQEIQDPTILEQIRA